jgi:hypothetical protein
MYIYFPLVEPVPDLVFFFARSPNRFSSRTVSRLHLPSPTTSSTLRLFPLSTLRLSLFLPSISPRFISSRNTRACNLLPTFPHPPLFIYDSFPLHRYKLLPWIWISRATGTRYAALSSSLRPLYRHPDL